MGILTAALSPIIRDARMDVLDEIRQALTGSHGAIIDGFAEYALELVNDPERDAKLAQLIKEQLTEALDIQQEIRVLMDKIVQRVSERVTIYTEPPNECTCGDLLDIDPDQKIILCPSCSRIHLW